MDVCAARAVSHSGRTAASGTCQCRTCRMASAAAIVPWITVNAEDFVITAGKPVETSRRLPPREPSAEGAGRAHVQPHQLRGEAARCHDCQPR